MNLTALSPHQPSNTVRLSTPHVPPSKAIAPDQVSSFQKKSSWHSQLQTDNRFGEIKQVCGESYEIQMSSLETG